MIRLFDGAVNELGGVPWDTSTYAQTLPPSVMQQDSKMSLTLSLSMLISPDEIDPETTRIFPKEPWKL